MPRFAGALLTMRGVTIFWLLWCAAFVLMLWAISPGRTLQDALAAELLQGHLAGGYQLRNPPLYEWLLWLLQLVLGPGPLSYLVLRYSLIASIGVLFHVAMLRTVASVRLASAFSLSLVLFYWFGWEAHHSVSHTLALLAGSLALWIAALAYARQPTSGRAFLVGLIVGTGVMAKWSFLLVLVSFALALALTKETRTIYRSTGTLAVFLGAALPILPFAVWLAYLDRGLIGGRALPQGREFSATQMLDGAVAFLTGIPLVFLPWIAFVIFFAWRFPRPQPELSTLSKSVAIRLAGLTAINIVALIAAIVLLSAACGLSPFGITRFAVHYLFPVSLFAALALSGLVAIGVNEERFAPRLAFVSLAVALLVFLLKLGSFYVVPTGSEATNLLPYAKLADELTRKGLGAAQFVTLSPRDAGNLAIYLPQARALSLSARIEPPALDPIRNRACVLLWGGEYSVPPDSPPPTHPSASKLLEPLGIGGSAAEAQDIAVDWLTPLIGSKRRSVWHLLSGATVEAVCQRVAAKGML